MDTQLEDLVEALKWSESVHTCTASAIPDTRKTLMDQVVAVAYELAKQGQWPRVRAAWASHEMFARTCAHHVKPSSGWSFLHQAALFGEETASRELIGLGAPIDLPDQQGRTPVDIARDSHHQHLHELLDGAAKTAGGLWAAPGDPMCRPSSCAWGQARAWIPRHDDLVAYSEGQAPISAGRRVWVDDFGRVLVGWHGTVDPPLDMGGYPLVGDRG